LSRFYGHMESLYMLKAYCDCMTKKMLSHHLADHCREDRGLLRDIRLAIRMNMVPIRRFRYGLQSRVVDLEHRLGRVESDCPRVRLPV
jgi:hypothetical protein